MERSAAVLQFGQSSRLILQRMFQQLSYSSVCGSRKSSLMPEVTPEYEQMYSVELVHGASIVLAYLCRVAAVA
jgi:hypothetical protein